MPLAGGAADKFGNRYEGKWTILQFAEILDEKIDSIRLEPPGEEGEGVEFFVKKGELTKYHQVKRQDTSEGRWTITSLARRGVLEKFYDKLNTHNSHCIFVSTHAAYQLDELSNSARGAISLKEFKKNFISSNERKIWFDALCSSWSNCKEEEAYQKLKQIFVETIGENTLQLLLESKIAPLVEGASSSTVTALLGKFALDKIHHQVIAIEIWDYLRENNCGRRHWGNDPHVLAAVEAQNSRYLNGLLNEAVLQTLIPREEALQAIDKLYSPNEIKSGVIITGGAGVGKSSLIPQITKQLQQNHWIVLAFRIDRLTPQMIPDQLGKELLLPGSPAHVLASIAKGRDCALIVDQIDAVSITSGRNPQFFECINELIDQTSVYPNMHLILGCRKFDVENDYRLQRLIKERHNIHEITIKGISQEKIREVLAKLHINSSQLSQKQLALLEIPLHLNLLSEIAQGHKNLTLNFETAKDLFDKFWERKRILVRERLGREVHWTQVIDRMCNYMNEHQVLSVPAIILDEDDIVSDVKVMVSEHVLTFDERVYSFFHETFFDYSFARRFASSEQRLLPFLLKKEQHLFKRAQVRQILLHEREYFYERYLEDLSQIISNEKIRFHLKSTVFALLKSYENPTKNELQTILSVILDNKHPLTNEVWQLVWTPAWFNLLDSLGYINTWLNSNNDILINQTVNVLRNMQRALPNRVAELLDPFVDQSEEWNNRLRFVMQWANLDEGRAFLDLFLKCLDKGILDDARGPIAVNSDFWDLSYGLAQKQPDWASEVIGHYFNRRLTIAISTPDINEADILIHNIFSDARDGHRDFFLDAAKGAPHIFVEQILPFMLEVMRLTVYNSEKELKMDNIWSYRSITNEYGSIKDFLLEGIVEALSLIAKSDVDAFKQYAEFLKQSNFETAQYILVKAYGANPVLADEAIEYLCEKEVRLKTGYSSNSYWATRELIKTTTQYCSEEALQKIENVLLNYYPDREKNKDGYKTYGSAQFTLLDGIPPLHQSKTIQQRLGEWRRKFKLESIEEPKGMEVSFVASPIPDNALDKMTDEQWLSAIYEYNNDSNFNYRRDAFKGGSLELARDFEAKVKQDPVRFVNLARKFGKNVNPVFFESALRGIEATSIDPEIALDLCRYSHQLPQRPVGQWITSVVAKLADKTLTDEDIEMVAWYATKDPDPTCELWETKVHGNDSYYNGDIDTTSINSVRGTAAGAVGRLIFHDQTRLKKLLPTIEKMVNDSTITVRAAVAFTLINILNHDRNLAVNLFLSLCNSRDELLRTRGVERFLNYALQTHYTILLPILQRMINSKDANTKTAGARLSCIMGLLLEEAQQLTETCIQGDETLRIGAAQVFAANLLEARFKEFCVNNLCVFFNDEAEEVRKAASECFRKLRNDQLGEYINLVDSFVKSEAFTEEHDLLFYALEKSTIPLPELSCLAFERFLEIAGIAVADISTHAAAESYQVSKLLIRLYSQSKDPHIQTRCLNLIDTLSQIKALGLNEALTDYERQ
ncbi:MAG: NACHT domain-containing protein [Pyrinomonadaceae bacterium]